LGFGEIAEISMRRLTISVDDELADTFDKLVADKGYENRSEAFRDLVRQALGHAQLESHSAKYCVGALSYIYNHHERQLASRLTSMTHDHHDLTVSTMHAHLDHENCIETVILQGPTEEVLHFADAIKAQPGVRHGNFYPIPIDSDEHGHSHGPGKHRHSHRRPAT
jgi:CopG family transcriptional regulator, nickel-responsive regulator